MLDIKSSWYHHLGVPAGENAEPALCRFAGTVQTAGGEFGENGWANLSCGGRSMASFDGNFLLRADLTIGDTMRAPELLFALFRL